MVPLERGALGGATGGSGRSGRGVLGSGSGSSLSAVVARWETGRDEAMDEVAPAGSLDDEVICSLP